MQSNHPFVISTPGKYSEFLDSYPRPPLLTSFLTTSWQNIGLTHWRQPAHQMSEICMPLHSLVIFPNAASVNAKIDGTSRQQAIAPGDVIIIPANMAHGGSWNSELEMIAIGLHPSLFDQTIDDATNPHPTELALQLATPDPLVHQIGLSLRTALQEDPIGSRLYAEAAAAMLAVHLLKHYGERKLEFKDYPDKLSQYKLNQVIDHIYAHLDQELGLAELAAVAHLSPHYFSRLFKQSTGMTPHQFLIHCRVERAQFLLLNGKDSIAEIAQQVGFANQAHLTLHMKRVLDVTPKMVLEQRKN
jgi:AraC family transcriptional regulator